MHLLGNISRAEREKEGRNSERESQIPLRRDGSFMVSVLVAIYQIPNDIPVSPIKQRTSDESHREHQEALSAPNPANTMTRQWVIEGSRSKQPQMTTLT